MIVYTQIIKLQKKTKQGDKKMLKAADTYIGLSKSPL